MQKQIDELKTDGLPAIKNNSGMKKLNSALVLPICKRFCTWADLGLVTLEAPTTVNSMEATLPQR